MAKTFSSMTGLVAIHTPGAPNPLIEYALREAAIDLCRRGKCYRDTQSLTLANAAFPYTISPPAGTKVVKVLRVLADGKAPPLSPIDEQEASRAQDDWKNTSGPLDSFVENPRGIVRLVPLPVTSAVLDVTIALEPSEAATDIPDDLWEKYHPAIVSGAIARLAIMPKRGWADAGLASLHAGLAESSINEAVAEFTTHYVMTSRFTAPRPL